MPAPWHGVRAKEVKATTCPKNMMQTRTEGCDFVGITKFQAVLMIHFCEFHKKVVGQG